MSRKEEELSFLNDADMNDGMTSDHLGSPSPGSYGGYAQSAGPAAGGTLGFIRQSRHPYAAAFHLLFKTMAILVYIFSGIFTSNFIFVCVVCILLLAFDFWTVKNVTGRYLVGLRWWNYVKEDGTNEWIFESLENMEDISPSDSRVFWWGLYAPVLIWGALLVVDVLKLEIQWLIVVIIALSMHIANIVGYTKCSQDAKKRIADLTNQGQAGLGMLQMFSQTSGFKTLVSSVFGGDSSSGGGSSSTSDSGETQQFTV